MMTASKKGQGLFLAVLGLAATLSLAAPAWADDVKVFNAPPSLDELREALGTKSPIKTRSIQIDESEAPAPDAAPTPAAAAAPAAAAPAPAPSAQAPAAAPVATHQAAKQPAHPAKAAVSEKAVAMRINFDYNSATIRPDSEGFVESIAKLLQAEPQASLVIEGHTDAKGSYAYNMQLSKSRAAAVRAMLISKYGISASRLIAIGRGPTEPLNAADPNSPDNRRVQFRLRA